MPSLMQMAQGQQMQQMPPEQIPPDQAMMQGGQMQPEQEEMQPEQEGMGNEAEQEGQQEKPPQDPTQLVGQMLMELLRGKNAKLIQDKLTDGQGDLEMEIAETAANVMRSIIETVRQQGREIPPKQVRQGVMMAITELINVSMRGGMLTKEQRTKTAERSLAMAMYALEAGAGRMQ